MLLVPASDYHDHQTYSDESYTIWTSIYYTARLVVSRVRAVGFPFGRQANRVRLTDEPTSFHQGQHLNYVTLAASASHYRYFWLSISETTAPNFTQKLQNVGNIMLFGIEKSHEERWSSF